VDGISKSYWLNALYKKMNHCSFCSPDSFRISPKNARFITICKNFPIPQPFPDHPAATIASPRIRLYTHAQKTVVLILP
jgi:hypothetical protein